MPGENNERDDIDNGAAGMRQQLKVPFRTVVTIAINGIRIRFWRSMVTAAGIVLGIAFLSYVVTNIVTAATAVTVNGAGFVAGHPADPTKATAVLDDQGRITSYKGDGVSSQNPPITATVNGKTFSPAAATRFDTQITFFVPTFGLTPNRVYNVRVNVGPTGPAVLKPTVAAITPSVVRVSGELYYQSIWLGVMSLLVSFVGIMDSMLMSVTERFREIGTMKCLGAPDDFVVTLFFVEATLTGILASAVGWIVGFVMSILQNTANGTPPTIPILTGLLLALGCTFGGGLMTLIATVLPARQAAIMPARLRYAPKFSFAERFGFV